MKSRFGYRTPIPSTSSSKSQTRQISYKDGMQSFKDNDDLKVTEVERATDARFIKIGRYRTRKGLNRYSVPVGQAVNVQVTSTAGAADQPVGGDLALAQKLTIDGAGRITRAEVRLKRDVASQGILLVEIYADNAGMPGELLCRSSIAPSVISDTYDYHAVDFVAAPAVTASQDVIAVIRSQSASAGLFNASTTTNSSNALTSSDGGAVWAPAAFSVNVKLYTSTSGGVKGLIRAYRPNGQKITAFAHGNSVLSINETTGATTELKSDFAPGSTAWRARMVQDALYSANGLEKPWKYDFDTWTQLTDAPYIPSLIEEHKGMLFFNDVEDKTRIFYSQFAEYGKYKSTDFIYVPAPKSYDALTAFGKLNGAMFLFANNNKFQLYGSDNDTFNLDEAASQRGTFTQETCVYDANFIYHADSEGIWRFDGSGEKNLALPFLEDYLAVPSKSTMQLDVFNNRLYCFYAPVGSADNTECFVMNLLLGVAESVDTGAHIGRSFGRNSQDDTFLQASNKVGAVYIGEAESNDHSNLGDQLQFEVRTAYNHFDTPGNFKRVPKWRPQFPSQRGSHSIQAGYDRDSEQNPKFKDVPVGGSGPRLNQGHRLNTGLRLAGQRMITPTELHIPGTFKRLQRRYQHVAAREPVELDSEILAIEIQRLI